jgi:hypothetical protein
MKKLVFCAAFVIFCFAGANAQPRLITKETEKSPAAIAPVSFQVKYEGGMFGFSKKQEGSLKFDDANFRLIFFDKDNKEQFGIPYKDLIVLYPQSQSVQSTSGKVVQNIPLPGAGIAGMFMKDKLRYMVVNFDDPDMNAKGTVNFKFESTQMMNSAIQTLGDKAEMQQRGEAFYRPQKKQSTATTNE